VSSLQKGINAAKAGRMQEALDFLKDAIIEEPQNADVWVWVAAIIDDLDKQEIFLEKALEIDPHNIPAQRGLAYLQKRKQDRAAVQDDHLSDHTQPISPFPASGRPKPDPVQSGWTKLNVDDLNGVASPGGNQGSEPLKDDADADVLKSFPKLSGLEIALLGVVVVVFMFIGILAASAIFDFDLPFDWLKGRSSGMAAEPPYAGVFLYENEIYFDIQKYEGLPTEDIGIPTSRLPDPAIILWESEADPERMRLIYETGEYTSFEVAQSRRDIHMIRPVEDLAAGLYCFQQTPDIPGTQVADYWCFHVDLPEIEK
jgi:tetratricopeptide (TPR) repeat protein